MNAGNGLWEVHSTHDVTRIWSVTTWRRRLDPGPWTRLRAAPAPFGEQASGHARKMLARRGEDPATEDEIARAAAALLDKAGQGPPRGREERRDRKPAARARANPPPARRAGISSAARSRQDPPDPMTAKTTAPAEVIPLGIFDAREEAKKWW